MDFLDRIGQLNIPTGLQGSQGPAGTNGAGWNSGSGAPSGAPPTDIKFYLNTTTGEVSEWNGSNWVQIIPTIFGTNGNVWFDGAGAPGVISGAVANDYYLDTVTGDIYQYNGVTWGSPILTIKGTNGAAGVNGTGLLGSAVTSASQTFSNTGTYDPLDTFLNPFEVTFDGDDAFPTTGSVVRSTMFIKARFTNAGIASQLLNSAEVYYVPRIVNVTTATNTDLLPMAVDTNPAISSTRIMYQPSAVSTHSTHGSFVDTSQEYAWARAEVPRTGTSGTFPFVHTKIVTTLVRVSSTAVRPMVEYTTTSRFGTYTGVYDTGTTITLGFSSSDQIRIGFIGSIFVPSTQSADVNLQRVYHIVEKSIL
jgi:hypothetical protein